MPDVNIEGHFQRLLAIFQTEPWNEFWSSLNLVALTFSALGLLPKTTDLIVWQTCQQQQLILVTANRNAHGPDSLEETIRAFNKPESLPVITLANPRRIMHERFYAERTAIRILDVLFDIDRRRGSGRLYVP